MLWNRIVTESLVEVKDTEGEQVWAIAWNQHSPHIFASRSNQVKQYKPNFFRWEILNQPFLISKQTILIWRDAQTCPNVFTQRYKFHENILRDVVWINADQFASCSDDGLILLCQIEKDSPLKSFNLNVCTSNVQF